MQSLIDLGLAVLPIAGKVPPGGHGYLDATADPDAAAALFARYPSASNVGIQPGRSGLLVVDLDDGKPEEAIPAYTRLLTVARRHGGLPQTLTVRTGSGGRHLYFHAPKDREIGQCNGIRNPDTGRTESGVDVRGTKGYVVVPPSIHPITGKPYEWLTGSGRFEWDAVAECPEWLLDFLDPVIHETDYAPPDWAPPGQIDDLDQRRVAGMVHSACQDIAGLGPGMSRRSELQRAAYRLGGLLWTGYPESQLYGELAQAAIACGHWDADTDRAVRMAMEDGKRDPVPLPPDSPTWNGEAERRQGVLEAIRAIQGPIRAKREREAMERGAPEVLDVGPDPDVVEHLLLTEKGSPTASLPNVVAVLERDRRQRGRWWLNAWTRKPMHGLREAIDADAGELRLWLQANYAFCPSKTTTEEGIEVITTRNARDPLREWLESLVWDGIPRLDRMAAECFGSVDEDQELAAAQGRMWAISAAARVLEPGCQVDTILVLHGAQGAQKTSALRELAGSDYFGAPHIEPGNKDTIQALQGLWIVEWAELDSLRRSESTATKAFISERHDMIRPAYGRRTVTLPRRCVFAGTTNDDQFLSDTTGDRRFWIVRVGACNLGKICAWREQLWAEAVARYRSGEPWWLDRELEHRRDEANQPFRFDDPWIPIAEAWVDARGVPFQVGDLLHDDGKGRPGHPPGLGISHDKATQYHVKRLKDVLTAIGLEEVRKTVGGKRLRVWVWPDPGSVL